MKVADPERVSYRLLANCTKLFCRFRCLTTKYVSPADNPITNNTKIIDIHPVFTPTTTTSEDRLSTVIVVIKITILIQ